MLTDVLSTSTSRLTEVRSYLVMLRAMSSSTPFSFHTELTTAKGLFFVHLYGAYEYTIAAAVQKTLAIISGFQHPISDFKPVMLSVVLDAQCRAAASVGPQKMWEKRWELFG